MALTPYYKDAKKGVIIYHDNCAAILPQLPQIDHIITDPPYESEAHTMARRSLRMDEQGIAKGPQQLVIPFAQMDNELRKFVGFQFQRIAKRWVLLFCQSEAAMVWKETMPSLKYIRSQIWVKGRPLPQLAGDRPGQGYETILTMHQQAKGKTRWNGGGRVGIYEHIVPLPGHDRRVHPTEKPLSLMRELVELFTDPNEIILDAFMGSGSTLLAASQLGRRAIGIEIEEKWCEYAAKAIELGWSGKGRATDRTNSIFDLAEVP